MKVDPSGFKALRDGLFHGSPEMPTDPGGLHDALASAGAAQQFALWKRLRSLGESPDPLAASIVLGVVMESGLDGGGTMLVYGTRDGDAGIYLSSGGGFIGGVGHAHIRARAAYLVKVAAGCLGNLTLTEEHPLPTLGRFRFSILTPTGARVAEAGQKEITDGLHVLSPVSFAADDILTSFRLLQQPNPNEEAASYVNCLLTTLARGSGGPALLTEGSAFPDPSTFIQDPDEHAWIATHVIPSDPVTQTKVMEIILQNAGFKRFQLGNEKTWACKLATHQKTLLDVSFQVIRRKAQGKNQIEIRKKS